VRLFVDHLVESFSGGQASAGANGSPQAVLTAR
jgi:hypothetical protein